MTRYARGNKGNHKRPHEASSWTELRDQGTDGQTVTTRTGTGPARGNGTPKTDGKSKKRKTVPLPSSDGHKAAPPPPMPGSDSDLSAALSRRLAPPVEEVKGGRENEMTAAEKKTRRTEQRRQKRIKSKANRMVCYHCREAGHGVADCPRMLRDHEQGTGICFRCGSTEHEAYKCTARVDTTKGEFPFAKCFICQEFGHLSRTCPDNPRGLYPLGGGCKHCGSVEHRNQHCPRSVETSQDEKEPTVPSLSSTLGWSADAEIDDFRPVTHRAPAVKKTPKVVHF